MDLRHRIVSRRVEEGLSVVKELTRDISGRDGRFQSIVHAGVHNESIKVHRCFECIGVLLSICYSLFDTLMLT